MPRLALILIVMAAGASVGEGARLRFARAMDMPESGLSLLLPAGAKPDPMPPPAILEGRREGGGQRERLELQHPLEVWRWKQQEGRWIDDRGNRLILAAPTLAVPVVTSDWLPKEEIPGLLQPLAGPGKSWSEAHLTRWLETFWGVSELTAQPLQRGRPFALAEVVCFQADRLGAKGLACAFRLTAVPDRWRIAIMELARETDFASAEKAWLEDFLPAIRPLARRALPAAAPAFAEGAGPISPMEESRARVRESIRNMKDWWYVEGSNTIVLSNIRSGKSQLVDAILEDLEKLRPVWEALVPPWTPAREVAVVRVFGTEAEYVRYVGPEMSWTSGLWMGSRRELMIRPVEEGSLMRKRRSVLAIVYHEGFHQYLDSAFEGYQAAAWFNEGYATLSGSISFSGKRVTFAKDPPLVAILAQLVRQGRADPARILDLDYAAFYGNDDETRRENYALAWGLLYFLQGEPDNRKTASWRGIPAHYATAFRESHDPRAATRQAFDGVEMKAFNKAFQLFWK